MPTLALGSIFIECNHFGGAPADLETFRRSELFYGDDVFTRDAGTVGGMLSVLKDAGADVKPLLVASACPSGPVTAECYAHLKSDLLARLRRLKVDGVLLALHGSAAVEGGVHLESDLLTAVRKAVGADMPVVATLDLHAHVTGEMVAAADALLAWETYPHRDAFDTGRRGAHALLDTVSGAIQPAMALAKAPIIVGAILGQTDPPGPFADVMQMAKSYEQLPGIYSTSAFWVHPYLDFRDMGSGGLVITDDGDLDKARSLARTLALAFWERRYSLEPETHLPADAIRRGLEIEGGPILLVETSDCCGGGAAGDSVATLRALHEHAPDQPAMGFVVDPAGAAACHRAGVGAELTLSLGHSIDPQWGRPLEVRGVVRRLSDGTFTYRGGIWEGQVGRLGPSAVLQVGGIEIGVVTNATYEWYGEQFDALGLDPAAAKFLVVKNPMNYRMRFAPLSRAVFILDTPGPTPATLRGRPFHNVQRPYWPADTEIPGFEPRVYA